MEPKVMYHWCEDAYGELFENSDDAVEEFLNELEDHDFTKFCFSIQTVPIYTYKQLEPVQMQSEHLLSFVLEHMDEDYLAEYMENTTVTYAMKNAAIDFLNVIKREYPQRVYGLADRVIAVNVLEWVAAHYPHWIRKVERD